MDSGIYILKKVVNSTFLNFLIKLQNHSSKRAYVGYPRKSFKLKFIRNLSDLFDRNSTQTQISAYVVNNNIKKIWKKNYTRINKKNWIKKNMHGENFIEIFTTLSVVIWFSAGTLGIFATLVYVFTMRVVIYDILSMAIITTLSTSILFSNLYYILL